jgi:solute:Na+ symporter, SSS family
MSNHQQLAGVDWAILVLYLLFTLAVGLFWRRRATRSISEFFLSGRNLPWWVAGTSMVATTFGSDTPLLVAGLVGQRGVAGNWWWWSFVMSNMLTVFFFAKIWRRSGVTTDVEFSELRYGGRGARYLRGFRSLYFGGLINTIVIGWIMLGGQGIICTLLNISPKATVDILGISAPLSLAVVFGLVLFVAFYSTMAGLWGVVSTDLIQFALATVGCLALAYYVVNSAEVGGLSGLREGVIRHHPLADGALALFPQVGGGGAVGISIFWFCTMMGAQWWASWYPGSEPGGGGYIVQRVLASRDERAAQLSTLWFTVAHYAVRPWPWILVALAGFVIWPDTASLFPESWGLDAGRARELTFIAAIPRFLPTGLSGLMLASLIAALMSTVDTHMNWGASYLVNDLYRRFFVSDRPEKHYVVVSRLLMLVTVIIAAVLSVVFLDNIQAANELLVSIGAGAGLVYIMRWFWPRINAYSELASMLGALVSSQVISRIHAPFAELNSDDQMAAKLLVNIACTTLIWLVVTFLTPPEDESTLRNFYTRCKPSGPWWRKFAAERNLEAPQKDAKLGLDWLLGSFMVWAAILFVGTLLLGGGHAVIYGLALVGTALYLVFRLRPGSAATS